MAQDQGPEFIDHSILLLRIVDSKILTQPPEEIALAALLALETEAYERGDRFAHAGVYRPGVPFHLLLKAGRNADTVSRFELVRSGPGPAGIPETSRRGCF